MNELTEKVLNDPLAMTIQSIIMAMRSDFGNRFTSQFIGSENDGALRAYKRRLYSKLKGFDVTSIADAYERYIDLGKTWPPTVPELVKIIIDIEKEKKQQKDAVHEANEVSMLPPPKKTHCNPLEMLAEAQIKATHKNDTYEAWLKRKNEALKNHNAVLTINGSKINRVKVDHEHTCSVSFCDKSGSLSASVNGSTNWYCAEHFQRKH